MKDKIIMIGAICSIASVTVRVLGFIKDKINDKIEGYKAIKEFEDKYGPLEELK